MSNPASHPVGDSASNASPPRRRKRRRLPGWAQNGLAIAGWGAGLYVCVEALIRLLDLIAAGGFDGREPGIVTFSQFLLHIPLVMLFVMWFTRRLPAWGFMACVAVAWGVNEVLLLDHGLHKLLESNGLYPPFINKSTSGLVNPQYAKLLCYGVALIGTVPLLLAKRLRSLDRLWVAIVAGAVLVTTFIFHLVIVQGAYSYAGKDIRHQMIEQVLKLDDPTGFDQFCAAYSFDCLRQPLDQPVTFGEPADQQLFGMLQDEALKDGADAPPRLKVWQSATAGELDIVLVANYGVSAKDGEMRILIDAESLTAINHHYVGWFSALSIAAHLIWIFGGMLVLYLHHRLWQRKRMRAAKRLSL